jgi:hypothetical protein
MKACLLPLLCSPPPAHCTDAPTALLTHASPPPLARPSCPTVQPNLSSGSATNICWTAQPPFSAIRHAAYGMGTLTFLTPTTAKWEMFRNVDAPGVAFDSVLLDRSLPATCAGARR